jgi:hypothetical protein
MKSSLSILTFLLVIVSVPVLLADGTVTRVSALEGRITIEMPRDWDFAQEGRKMLLGPKGKPVAEIAYVELTPADPATPIDAGFLRKFVQQNLKVEGSENLSDGRILGHTIERPQPHWESHQWNVARRLDATHFGILLVSMDVADEQASTIKAVEAVARSAQFTNAK